jgi:hypothetical protein
MYLILVVELAIFAAFIVSVQKIFIKIFNKYLKRIDNKIQLFEIYEKRIKSLIGNMDISVDVHQRSPSWAVLSIKSRSGAYVKFIELGDMDAKELALFLRKYEKENINTKIDASPYLTQFFKAERR